DLNINILFCQQITTNYPTILTPGNVRIIGVTHNPQTCSYYLVFYRDLKSSLDEFMSLSSYYDELRDIPFDTITDIEEVGFGEDAVIYTANYNNNDSPKRVALKWFEDSDKTITSFIAEVSKP